VEAGKPSRLQGNRLGGVAAGRLGGGAAGAHGGEEFAEGAVGFLRARAAANFNPQAADKMPRTLRFEIAELVENLPAFGI